MSLLLYSILYYLFPIQFKSITLISNNIFLIAIINDCIWPQKKVVFWILWKLIFFDQFCNLIVRTYNSSQLFSFYLIIIIIIIIIIT